MTDEAKQVVKWSAGTAAAEGIVTVAAAVVVVVAAVVGRQVGGWVVVCSFVSVSGRQLAAGRFRQTHRRTGPRSLADRIAAAASTIITIIITSCGIASFISA